MHSSRTRPPDGEPYEAVQDTLDRGEPAMLASYSLIGAILLLGAAGYLTDRWLDSGPWGLLIGLIVGLLIGLYRVGLVALRRT